MSHSATPVELPIDHPTEVSSNQLAVKFWGVRGHLPLPGLAAVQYGGNTACLELSTDKHRLIFDGGTGLKALGDTLEDTAHQQAHRPSSLEDGSPLAHVFFTHARWDRIQGFPFFRPAFQPGHQLEIYGAAAANGASIKQCLSTQMLQPYCSVAFNDLAAGLRFHNLMGGQTLTLDALQIETLITSRNTQAMGYRIRHQGRTVVYATEVSYATMGPALAKWSREADLLICNGGNSPKVIDTQQPRPPWQSVVELAIAAQVKKTVIMAFSPDQTDQQLNDIAEQLKVTSDNIHLAQEGIQISL